jgi:PAS domain S-box-containing protein
MVTSNKLNNDPFKRASFERRLYAFCICIIIILVTIFYLLNSNYKKLKDAGNWVEHTCEVLYQSEKTNGLYEELVAASRGYVLSDRKEFNERFSADTILIKSQLAKLLQLTRDNASQQQRINDLSNVLSKRTNFAARVIDTKRATGIQESMRLIQSGEGILLSGRIDSLINSLQKEEQGLLQARILASEENRKNVRTITWLLVLALLVIFSITIYIVITTLRMRETMARELAKSEAWFSKTLSGIGDGIIATDTGGHINFMNPVAETLTGWTEKTAKGMHVDEVFRLVDEKTREVIPSPVVSVIKTRTVAHIPSTTLLIRENGQELAVDDSAAPINDRDGNFIGVVLVFRDVEKERHAAKLLEQKVVERTAEVLKGEQKYRETLDNMLEGAQIIDRNWRYVYVNKELVQQAKLSREELLGHTMMEKYPGIENTPLFRQLQKCMSERIDSVFENEFKFPDGSVGCFQLSIQAVPEGIFILSIDISARKRAELELKKFAEELEEKVKERTAQLTAVNAELESFSYSVSHDLRAPLRAISGYSSILEEDYGDKLDNEAKRVIKVIQDNVKQMGQLINDLLAFSRMGKHELVKTDLDMNKLVNDVVKEQLEPYKGNRPELIVKPLDSIYADESMIKQVIINLVSNAIKYSSKVEAPVIEIGSYPDNGNTVFYVKDNGEGFSMEYYNKLFGVFQRLHSPADFEGVGVGLALVKRIITRHLGQVWAESKVKEGATFYFSLPRKKEEKL